ncbi:hypothetical protein D3C71_1734230 [compost metagenome]
MPQPGSQRGGQGQEDGERKEEARHRSGSRVVASGTAGRGAGSAASVTTSTVRRR